MSKQGDGTRGDDDKCVDGGRGHGQEQDGSKGDGDDSLIPFLLSPWSFVALGRLLRAVLDQAARDGSFLHARNCLVVSGLFAVSKDAHLAWLQETSSPSSGNRLGGIGCEHKGAVGGGGREGAPPAAEIYNVLPSESMGEEQVQGKLLFLQWELRKHPIWKKIELWEVTISDSIVMAMQGGGNQEEQRLPAATVEALDKRFGEENASKRQLDVKLGQLAYMGYSMLQCGILHSEVHSLLSKCSTLAMEVPLTELDALMATLDFYVAPSRQPLSIVTDIVDDE
ncbi:unnamed protein product [Choristocarpus tenellus]